MSEKADLPITSPVVLVRKRNKKEQDFLPGSREASLSLYRFCVDFRYLNSQTKDFQYPIPDLQELTESFADNPPNYITCIDLSQGFFNFPSHQILANILLYIPVSVHTSLTGCRWAYAHHLVHCSC